MGFYNEQVLPRLVDLTCGSRAMDRWRQRAVEGLSGTIVEIGSGSGANLPVLPDAVDHVYAVEPSEVARRRATGRELRAGLELTHVGLDGEAIPLADDSCDGALSTFVLCTVPHPEVALAELRRVLRPGGRFHFLEHGRAPDPEVLRWQERLEPAQKRIAGGCHLTRDVRWMVTEAGFQIESVESRYAQGLKPWTWFTLGRALNPSDD